MSGDESPLTDGALSVSILGGWLGLQKDVGLPFQLDLISGLGEAGVVNETTAAVEAAFPALPRFPPDREPTAAIGFESLAIGFGLYVAGKLSDALVGEIISQLYEAKVKPAVARLNGLLRHSTASGQPMVATFDHWFDGSGVLIRIRVYTDIPVGPDPAVVAIVLRHAAEWVRLHPPTHRVLTFEVRNGQFDEVPIPTEPR